MNEFGKTVELRVVLNGQAYVVSAVLAYGVPYARCFDVRLEGIPSQFKQVIIDIVPHGEALGILPLGAILG